eukprot:scaffold8333_cov71-Skeletonema_dohrnii-CCMP3373.AAC.2
MAGAPRAQFRKLAHSAVSHMPQMPTETCSLVKEQNSRSRLVQISKAHAKGQKDLCRQECKIFLILSHRTLQHHAISRAGHPYLLNSKS